MNRVNLAVGFAGLILMLWVGLTGDSTRWSTTPATSMGTLVVALTRS